MPAPRPVPWHAVRASVARIASFEGAEVEAAPESEWDTGDYVVCEVDGETGRPYEIETVTGRIVEVVSGDLMIGALGARAATLEAVGDWRAPGGGRLHTLTRAGLVGRVVSAAPAVRSSLVPLAYLGHTVRGGRHVRMRDEAVLPAPVPLDAPVIVLIGTSMSAGKTTSAIAIIRRLRRLGLRVAATKVTGVARYRDVLAMGDAGASPALDFVDVGLPSTICPPDEYRPALAGLVSRLASAAPEVVVVECGASPLEPYNVDLALESLRPHVCCTILCASDPYAVLGVAEAYDVTPDIVAGRATSTTAGIALVERLTGAHALNLLDPEAQHDVDAILRDRLGLSPPLPAAGSRWQARIRPVVSPMRPAAEWGRLWWRRRAKAELGGEP